jgi:pyridoxine/pyridoxamine 5'-phosphate oxidase
MKALIEKTSLDLNQSYFEQRDKKKNALSISSDQSSYIKSYEDVKNDYKKVFESKNLLKCPKYWGGYFFIPFYFEFWQGNASRINKREIYELKNDGWMRGFLQP